MVKTDLSYHFSFKNFLLDYTSLSFDCEFFNDFCVKKWSVMVEKNICVERILHCVKKWDPLFYHNKMEVARNRGFITIEALYHNKIELFFEKKVGSRKN